jgi:hypothetical protein
MTFKQINEIFRHEEVRYLDVQTVTAGGDTRTNPLKIRYGRRVVFYVDVTAVGGTSPALTIYVDVRDPVSGNWVNAGQFSVITAAGTYRLPLDIEGVEYSLRWVVGGTTPSFTFGVGVVIIK